MPSIDMCLLSTPNASKDELLRIVPLLSEECVPCPLTGCAEGCDVPSVHQGGLSRSGRRGGLTLRHRNGRERAALSGLQHRADHPGGCLRAEDGAGEVDFG